MKCGELLTGLIYLHRIADNRVGGVAKKNIRLFKKLVRDSPLYHALLTLP